VDLHVAKNVKDFAYHLYGTLRLYITVSYI